MRLYLLLASFEPSSNHTNASGFEATRTVKENADLVDCTKFLSSDLRGSHTIFRTGFRNLEH